MFVCFIILFLLLIHHMLMLMLIFMILLVIVIVLRLSKDPRTNILVGEGTGETMGLLKLVLIELGAVLSIFSSIIVWLLILAIVLA